MNFAIVGVLCSLIHSPRPARPRCGFALGTKHSPNNGFSAFSRHASRLAAPRPAGSARQSGVPATSVAAHEAVLMTSTPWSRSTRAYFWYRPPTRTSVRSPASHPSARESSGTHKFFGGTHTRDRGLDAYACDISISGGICFYSFCAILSRRRRSPPGCCRAEAVEPDQRLQNEWRDRIFRVRWLIRAASRPTGASGASGRRLLAPQTHRPVAFHSHLTL